MVMYNYKAGRTIKDTADVTGTDGAARGLPAAHSKGGTAC